MFYHIFKYLGEYYDIPGSGMFQYISFRAAAAIILALLIVIIFGRKIIDFLRRKQIGEDIRATIQRQGRSASSLAAAFSRAQATMPLLASTWVTDAPAARHASVAPPV